MIISGNSSINNVYYSGYTISKIYACGGSLVWSGGTGPTPPLSDKYLTIVPRGNGSIQLSGATNTFQYSFNSGATWNNATNRTSITMNDGVPLWLKGTLTVIDTNKGIGKFITSTDFDVEGNPSSLIYGEDFSGKTTLPTSAFHTLFVNQPVINTSGMAITAVGTNSYYHMFDNCDKLVSVPKMQVSTMATDCFLGMFSNCESLITVPTDMLTATTLASNCYGGMFQRCRGLTNAPVLPATTLSNYCYNNMFYGCTSLTAAPELPATTLANNCYAHMFDSCTSLNNITCLATDVSATKCTEQWVNGVAANGTFTKASGFLGWPQGADGIPNGWTVVDA